MRTGNPEEFYSLASRAPTCPKGTWPARHALNSRAWRRAGAASPPAPAFRPAQEPGCAAADAAGGATPSIGKVRRSASVTQPPPIAR